MGRGGSLRILAVVVAASGCFIFNRGGRDRTSAFGASQSEIALSVTNHNYLDVVVYVVHDGQRTRVGTVTGSSSTTFFIPVRLLGQGREIRLLGDPVGSPEFARTETIVVQPGQYVEWTLETDLRRSAVAVY